MSSARSDILNGWKEIAQYVGRDVRTVERWEKQRGLPARRIPGAGRSTVYARVSELEEWLASSKEPGLEAAAQAVASVEPAADFTAHMESAVVSGPETSAGSQPEAAPQLYFPAYAAPAGASSARRKFLVPALALAAGIGFALLVTLPLARRAGARPQPAGQPTAQRVAAAGVLPASTRHSPVAGVDELYLRGMFFFEQRTPDTLNRALQHFKAATEKDPNYAPAYVGLANTYSLLREYSVVPDEVAFSDAKAADEKAIALDPKLPQAHASLGFIDYFWSLDAPAAEKEFQTALALDPSCALAHHWYGSVLTHEGRYTEALHELDLAQNLQPSSSAIFTSRAFAWGLSGHRDEARAMLEEHLAQDQNRVDHSSSTAYIVLGILDMMEPHDVPAFLRAWRRGSELRRDNDSLQAVTLAEAAYQRSGEAAMWKSILQNEEKHHADPSVRMVDSELVLGQTDKAFTDLDKVMLHHDRRIIGVFVDPLLFPLRKDPRYVTLRAELHLPPPN